MRARQMRKVFIDPSYTDFHAGRLFDVSNQRLNRDNQLLPFVRLKQALEATGAKVSTADLLEAEEVGEIEYWSFGLMEKFARLQRRGGVRFSGFVIMEPPLVAPRLYERLPELTRLFERVYIHNTQGDGYCLKGVDQSRLRTLYWPQPYGQVQPQWQRIDRLNKAVVIAGRHNAGRRRPEYYSSRIKAMAELSRMGVVDLFGRGWRDYWSRQSISWAYLRHFSTLQAIYRGECNSKMDVLAQYRFSLCLENMPMTGYLTEKIFDCLYAGTVPIYLGAPDIEDLLPAEAYIDARRFQSWTDAWRFAAALPQSRWLQMRECGREFVQSPAGRKYFEALENMLQVSGGRASGDYRAEAVESDCSSISRPVS